MDRKNQREIKFKILKIDLHSFLYDEGRTILEIGIEDLGAIRHNPKNYLFIQYTGLKDRNDKEIYEGDLVEKRGWIGRIFWSGDFWATENGNYDDAGLGGENNTLEVIGNIYENPELLDNYLKKFREWCLRKWGNG